MARRGLSKEEILCKAFEMIEEQGMESFSLRNLATGLEIKAASLYNHITGIGEINEYVANMAAEKMNMVLIQAVEGEKTPQAALKAGMLAYREFAFENPQLYKILMKMPGSGNDAIVSAGFRSFKALRKVIEECKLEYYAMTNFIRTLRATMHGYVVMVESGFMARGSITHEETYNAIVSLYVEELGRIMKKG